MKNLKVFILTLLCLFVMIACQQEDPLSPLGDEYLSWNAFYEKNGVKPQTFTVDAATGGTFNGDKGMTLIIPPHAFVDKFGLKVSGEVTIRFCEFTSLTDMFLSGLHTMTGEEPLVSAGSFKFEALQGDEVLEFAPNAEAHVMIPPVMEVGDYADEMYPFIWMEDVFREESVFAWRMSTDLQVEKDTVYDAYDLIFSRVGLHNCDAFYNWAGNWNTAKTDFKVSIEGAEIKNSRVIIMVKELSSLVELTMREGETLKTYDYSIPIGLEGKLLVVSMEGDKLKFGHQDIKVAGKETFEIEVTNGTEKELQALLDNPF